MTDPTQDYLADIETAPVRYSTFWQRFFASLLDGIVLAPFGIADSYNRSNWQSYPVFLLLFLITLLYKPFLEIKYGATLGKMVMKLTVVNTAYQKADARNILLRNIFDIFERLFTGIVAMVTFSTTNFTDAGVFDEYINFSGTSTALSWVTTAFGIIVLIDAIFLLADDRRRALHDRIGQTFVIQK